MQGFQGMITVEIMTFFISKVWNETHRCNKYDIMAGNGYQRICGRNSRTRKRGGKCKYNPSNAKIDSIVELILKLF